MKENRFDLIATTQFGLEEILESELKALGAKSIRMMNRSIAFESDTALLYKANIHCRTAVRILKPLRLFRIKSQRDLYTNIQRVNWLDIMSSRQTLAVDVNISNSLFNNSMYAAQLAKDAVVDQFRKKINKRPSVDKREPDVLINLHIKNNEVTLSIDTSGIPLYKRGYRQEKGIAPLNEVLASGLIAMSEWKADMPLIDPMCGSGTILIEAAMKEANIPPGLNRKFAFMKWGERFNRSLYEKIIDEAKTNIREELPVRLYGSDMKGNAVTEAKANARRAGVNRFIDFSAGKFENSSPPERPSTLMMNPPYGERMKRDDIFEFYKSIGDTLKQNYQECTAFIFTGNLDASKKIGLRTSQRIKLYNGPLESRLLKFDLYAGTKKIRQ